MTPTLAYVIQYRQAVVPSVAHTQPLAANMGLLMVDSSVPSSTMRAGDTRSASVPLTPLATLARSCDAACRFPICGSGAGPGSRGWGCGRGPSHMPAGWLAASLMQKCWQEAGRQPGSPLGMRQDVPGCCGCKGKA